MVKITKTMQPKHLETQSTWLKSFVETASTIELPLLPKHLSSFPSRWPFGRGDLYHWIPLLNRFDSILEHFSKTYSLKDGPQQRDFALDVLLNQDEESPFSTERQWDMHQLTELGFPDDGDRVLIEAVLRFSRMLLEHCGNRSIYASSAHLNDLLNCISSSILISTLEVGSELAQRYQASVKRIANPTRQISSALLANHYNFDLERVHQMAMPFVKTPIVNLADATPSTTPISTKGKEKAHGSSGRNSTATHANDLVAICTCDDARWESWGDIKVLYYPQAGPSLNEAPHEPGHSSAPTTPTPLRRSHTIGSLQNTPRARNANTEDSSPILPRTPAVVDEQVTSGQRLFELPRSVIASTSICELVKRCPADMPPPAKYEVFHRLRVAKALTESLDARRHMLATRLLAITNLAYIHSESNFVERVLRHDIDETRRYQLVYQLAELIHPAADANASIPLWLQTFALALLEAISGFTAKCQDVLSALNANVNHGILLYVIRKAVAGMQVDNDADAGDQATEEDDWRNNLFSLTLHLSMSTRVGSEMVSAGLMNILVEILNIRSHVAQRHHSMVLAFLDGLIWTYQNAFTSFFNASGLDAVAKLLVDAVAEAQGSQQSFDDLHADQQSAAVDYEIPYYQQQTLKWLLKFVHHIMTNAYSYGGNTDRLLRNLAEKSDLLQSLRDIIANKGSFGSVVWTHSVTILSDFINNDPTSFAAISESGMIKTYLEAVTGRTVPEQQAAEEVKQSEEQQQSDDAESPNSSAAASVADEDDRSHPPSDEDIRKTRQDEPAQGILASSEAINIVPQVLNSICLNNSGMKMVLASKAFDSFLEIFESPAHVSCMESDHEIASNVGANFDELARHHPPLRAAISNAVIDMVARVRWLGVEKGINSDWGVRLYVATHEEVISTVHPNGYFTQATTETCAGTEDNDSETVDVDMSDENPPMGGSRETLKQKSREKNVTTKVVPSQSLTPYIHALANFLTSYLTNSFLKTNFVKRGGIELLLDLCESPSLDAAFADSAASRVLNQVIAQLIEHSPVWGLPSVLRRAQNNIDTLQPLAVKTEALPPYFGAFLSPDLLVGHDGFEVDETVTTATQKVKALLNAQTFIKIISDCFTTSRSNYLQFYHVNVYDYYLRLVKSIGPLLRGVLAEEAGELLVVPQHWSLRRQGAPGAPGSTDNREGAREGTSIPDVLNSTTNTWNTDGGIDASSPAQPTEQEQSTARYINYETLRILLHPMIPTAFPLFQSLGKALLPRREPNQLDPFPRPRQLEIAMALADTVLSHLAPSVARSEPTSKDFHYWIITLHTIHEMLIDHPSSRQSDRSNVQIIIPVLLAFKEQGGLNVLNNMLRVFASSAKLDADGSPDESSRAKVAAFGLKKVLDLYHVLLNGKYLSDSCGHYSLQRQAERSLQPNVFHQIVVEFRAAILPAVMELWTSSFIEKATDPTVKRLLDIIKIVIGADHEILASFMDDWIWFNLFKYKDARFKWSRFRSIASESTHWGYDDELVHEAIYRANGTRDDVAEYCRAHVNGLAGPRNPIPAEDADLSGLKEDASKEEEEPNNAAATPATLEVEPMNLDTLPELTWDGPVRASSTVNNDDPSEENSGANVTILKERLDSMRSNIRGNLIDQCLDVIRTHPETAIDVSDLVASVVFKERRNAEDQEEVASTLTFALSSMALDEEEKRRNGKCIAAYAHLLALLLQDEKFFDQSTEILADKVDEYVGFLKLPLASSADELPPWIPYILLVLEALLCRDERPVPVQWRRPRNIDEPFVEPVVVAGLPLVGDDNRSKILVSLLDLLPRIGKEETLATAVLRVLVILTRKRAVAKIVGEKKNLQRLFLMAKQLSGTGSECLKQTRLTAHVITILRHIIEDEETMKQIFRTEIPLGFNNLLRSTRGHADVPSYLRVLAPLALRAPDLFVEVSNELLYFTKWKRDPDEINTPSPLGLKDHVLAGVEQPADTNAMTGGETVKASTEPSDKEMIDAPKTLHDVKRPVVENPDGVIHFLLCELVNYREVDDKEPSAVIASIDTEIAPASTDLGNASLKDSSKDDNAKEKKQPKPVFKAEEHPIFVYRCLLLNCLAELLQSYTRTKVEFINFKRSAPPLSTTTPIKPRTSILNYLIYDLLCQSNLNGITDTVTSKKRAATSALTQKVLVALVSKTGEKQMDRGLDKFAYDDEPDLLFVRKFVLDTILKAYEKAPLTDEPLETRYSRMQCLAEVMNQMIGENDRENPNPRNYDYDQSRSQAQLRRLIVLLSVSSASYGFSQVPLKS
ncbi:hypothetical protein E4U43_005841 [Claviceps pusilla]|uniref:HECT-type E3 ubiquitin transferase n=1 Tax=Claviceps pusilla TaxID=123648 RepID=A0A9P7NGV7_9HYPO|nr:hypothetical protein E4U43_005841 [Claviceps pusilla]